MIRLVDAVDIYKFVTVVGDLEIFDYNFIRLKKYLKNMVFLYTPQSPELLFELLGLSKIEVNGITLDGIDVGNVIIERFQHLHYNNEQIIIDERPISDILKFATIATISFLNAEPSRFQFLILKGDDNKFYFNLFSSKFRKEEE